MYIYICFLSPCSVSRFEVEVVSMSASMCNGDEEVAGSLTSGGTESVLMAVKSYRDRAHKLWPYIQKPNMIAAKTVHPAFNKAAHYFGVDLVLVPVGDDFRMDVAACAQAINSSTILIVASAPQYCHGVVDPIAQLGELALKRGLPLHVDACFGGFMLPWLEKIGRPVPLWDFRVPGVTSISADVHKYGYSSKGASVVLYRNRQLRSYQYFTYAEWPGGLFGSPSMSGSRPGGMIAAAWAALVGMGENGYMELARQIMSTTDQIKAGVRSIEGLYVLGEPDMTALAIGGRGGINIIAVADALESLGGWKMERQQTPPSIHMTVLPQHARYLSAAAALFKFYD
jgi:sphinganine-1-phosphate aldolase